ncbi:hypothetical protein FRC20_005869 [Serendipita sp. 405]|nr:hypothetical protein FRC20_005869 [Serendipita sp. 405]
MSDVRLSVPLNNRTEKTPSEPNTNVIPSQPHDSTTTRQEEASCVHLPGEIVFYGATPSAGGDIASNPRLASPPRGVKPDPTITVDVKTSHSSVAESTENSLEHSRQPVPLLETTLSQDNKGLRHNAERDEARDSPRPAADVNKAKVEKCDAIQRHESFSSGPTEYSAVPRSLIGAGYRGGSGRPQSTALHQSRPMSPSRRPQYRSPGRYDTFSYLSSLPPRPRLHREQAQTFRDPPSYTRRTRTPSPEFRREYPRNNSYNDSTAWRDRGRSRSPPRRHKSPSQERSSRYHPSSRERYSPPNSSRPRQFNPPPRRFSPPSRRSSPPPWSTVEERRNTRPSRYESLSPPPPSSRDRLPPPYPARQRPYLIGRRPPDNRKYDSQTHEGNLFRPPTPHELPVNNQSIRSDMEGSEQTGQRVFVKKEVDETAEQRTSNLSSMGSDGNVKTQRTKERDASDKTLVKSESRYLSVDEPPVKRRRIQEQAWYNRSLGDSPPPKMTLTNPGVEGNPNLKQLSSQPSVLHSHARPHTPNRLWEMLHGKPTASPPSFKAPLHHQHPVNSDPADHQPLASGIDRSPLHAYKLDDSSILHRIGENGLVSKSGTTKSANANPRPLGHLNVGETGLKEYSKNIEHFPNALRFGPTLSDRIEGPPDPTVASQLPNRVHETDHPRPPLALRLGVEGSSATVPLAARIQHPLAGPSTQRHPKP